MVRNARIHDLAAVARIIRAGFAPRDRWGPLLLLDKLADGGRLRVDEGAAGLIRGFVLLERRPAGTNVRYIAVDPLCRGKGVGRGLLATVTGPAFAWVRASNTASQAMFRAAGWAVALEPPPGRRGGWLYFHQATVTAS